MEREIKEMSFEELVLENKKLCDMRTKAYRELKKKLIEVYVPALIQALKNAEKKRVYIEMEHKPFDDFTKNYRQYEEYPFYVISFDSDGNCIEGMLEEGFMTDSYKLKDNCKMDVSNLENRSVLELAVEIKSKIAKINERMKREIELSNNAANA